MQTIQDADDISLSVYRSLKGKELEKDGIFIAEGEKVVKGMIESGCKIASCLTAESAIARYRPLIKKMQKKGAAVYIAEDEFKKK